MINLAKYRPWNDQLNNSMILWEIHIPSLSLMWEICMKMNELKKKILNLVKSKILKIWNITPEIPNIFQKEIFIQWNHAQRRIVRDKPNLG